MKFSIAKQLEKFATTQKRQWPGGRLSSVGASEAGRCIRQVWMDKHEVPRDADFVETYGTRIRGTTIEDKYWEPGLRATLPPGVQLLFAGLDQKTLIDPEGFLSATTDGLLVGVSRDALMWLGVPDIGSSRCVNLDCKSIDPRTDIRSAKSEHIFQVQAQMGIIRQVTEYQPEWSILSYLDASDWSIIHEFPVQYDPQLYEVAKARARHAMTAASALELRPEGKMAGGYECGFCPWSSHCAGVTVAGIPADDKTSKLSPNAVPELKALRDRERALAQQMGGIKEEYVEARENIKELLRANGVRRHRGLDWSVTWSPVKGRTTYDVNAMRAAGIDVKPFEQVGDPSDQLLVK